MIHVHRFPKKCFNGEGLMALSARSKWLVRYSQERYIKNHIQGPVDSALRMFGPVMGTVGRIDGFRIITT